MVTRSLLSLFTLSWSDRRKALPAPGAGFDYAWEVEHGGFGVRRTDKRALWRDAIDATTRRFVEEPFAGWNSAGITMPPRNVLPKPVQKPHPPLWVACSRPMDGRLELRGER